MPDTTQATAAEAPAAVWRGFMAWLPASRPLGWGGFVLALWYAQTYLAFPDLPGNRSDFPAGWWGWWDQSQTLASTRAFAHGILDPSQHWYPLGYSLLGAPFYRNSPEHPFFFVDLACLLLTYTGVVAFARRLGLPTLAGVVVFVLVTVPDRFLFSEWVIPWNTTPVAALIWLLLAAVAAWCDGERRPVVVGLLAAAIPLVRPTDALFALPCLAAVVLADIRQPLRRQARAWLRIAVAGGGLLAAYLVLYLSIYGPHPSAYMQQSRDIGFTLHRIWWKAYVIFVEPRAWFMDGEGLLRRAPWIALGIAGVLPALLRGRAAALLAVVLLLHAGLYLAYVDLLPMGFWRYNNVHYWVWAIPGYGVLAMLLLRDLASRMPARRRGVAAVSLAATLVVLCIHINPRRVGPDAPAQMLAFSGPAPGFDPSYFGPLNLIDARGRLANLIDMRAFPTPGGMRVLALRRAFEGAVAWEPGHAPASPALALPTSRWGAGLSFGRPCWLPLIRCRFVTSSGLLPPPPPY
jgi:hypothetical protein